MHKKVQTRKIQDWIKEIKECKRNIETCKTNKKKIETKIKIRKIMTKDK